MDAVEAQSALKTWHAIVQRTLKANDVKLVVYVPAVRKWALRRNRAVTERWIARLRGR